MKIAAVGSGISGLYLAYCEAGFDEGRIDMVQTVWVKERAVRKPQEALFRGPFLRRAFRDSFSQTVYLLDEVVELYAGPGPLLSVEKGEGSI